MGPLSEPAPKSLMLYSYRRCPFAMRVRMVLEEKKIPYIRIEEDLSNLSPELLSLHPEGRVPLLVDTSEKEKIVIYQSTIITEYLEEKFPQNPLLPRDPGQRAEVRLWTYWCDQIFKPDLDLYKYERKNLSDAENTALEERLHLALQKWDAGAKTFLVGEQFTLADIHLFPFARQFLAIKPALPNLEQYSNLAAWLERMTSREIFDVVMAK